MFTKHQTTRRAPTNSRSRVARARAIHHPPVSAIRVLRFHVVLQLAALGFLDNVQSSEVGMDGTNVETECFPGPHRPTTRE